MVLAWHYSKAVHWNAISESGVLRPATTGIEDGERAILWFSSNQFWEPTAGVGLRDESGTVRTASMEETIAAVGGLVRFGVALENLIPWPQIGVDAGMPPDLVEAINQAGELGGSKPSEWYGVFETLAVAGTVIEAWNVKEQHWARVWTPENA